MPHTNIVLIIVANIRVLLLSRVITPPKKPESIGVATNSMIEIKSHSIEESVRVKRSLAITGTITSPKNEIRVITNAPAKTGQFFWKLFRISFILLFRNLILFHLLRKIMKIGLLHAISPFHWIILIQYGFSPGLILVSMYVKSIFLVFWESFSGTNLTFL